MTPTREQLQQWVDRLERELCPHQESEMEQESFTPEGRRRAANVFRAFAAALTPPAPAPMPPIEVRMAKLDDGREEFDEVVAGPCRHVHLEKMDDQTFALMIYTERETACFHIFTKNRRAHIDACESWRDPEPANGTVWTREPRA